MDAHESNDTPTPRPGPRRLTRRQSGKVIAGVCSGLGAYTGTDPVLWRLGFVAAAVLSAGAAVIVYVVAALIVPYGDEDDESSSPPVQIDLNRWMGIGLLIAGLAMLAGLFAPGRRWGFDAGVLWGLLLVGAGVALWSRAPTDELETENESELDPESVSRPPGSTLVTERSPASVKRRRSPLGRMTMGVVALAAGLGLLLDSLGVVDVSWATTVAVALVVVGGGLVVGAWWGRARGLIGFGILLSVLLAAAVVVPVPVRGGVGERVFRPASTAELRSHYDLGVGSLLLDLSRVDRGRTEVTLGIGELVVIVPADADVVAGGRVGMGESTLFGSRLSGLGLRDRRRGGEPGAARLQIRAQLGVGSLTVRQATAAVAPTPAPEEIGEGEAA